MSIDRAANKESRTTPNQAAFQLLLQFIDRAGLTKRSFLERLADQGYSFSDDDLANWGRAGRAFPRDWSMVRALVRAVTQDVPQQRRCTAPEALRFLELVNMPFAELQAIAALFPEDEFNRALAPYLPATRLAQAAPAADSLPSGTITFLFTDIVNSTQLWAQHTQAMSSAIAQHDRLLRQAIIAHGGVIFKTVGDAFCAAFASALDGLAAALTGQRALAGANWPGIGAIQVRMALHTGVAEVRDGDYFGIPLSRVARLVAAAHGGQILLSHLTQELVRDYLPPDMRLRDLGEHRLKDLIRPEHIFQLIAPDLPADFPVLATLDRHLTNLPIQQTPLIGRDREITAARAILEQPQVRLLTLTGPGGTGKTRLALQLAAELLGSFTGGVYFVPLAPILDPTLVASMIAQALEVKETGGQPLIESLKSFLRDKRLLLLLDNFEHVLAAVTLIPELLASAAGLKVLVTSRALLHLSAEHEFAVPPLTLPDRANLPSIERLTQYDAVRLFIERARALKPDFAVTNENAPASTLR